MALSKITPTHMAIKVIDDTIKNLKLQRAALVATLPAAKLGTRQLVTQLTSSSGKKFKVKGARR